MLLVTKDINVFFINRIKLDNNFALVFLKIIIWFGLELFISNTILQYI